MNDLPEKVPLSVNSNPDETPEEKRLRAIVEEATRAGYRMARADMEQQPSAPAVAAPQTNPAVFNSEPYDERLSFITLFTKRNFTVVLGCIVALVIINAAVYIFSELARRLFSFDPRQYFDLVTPWLNGFIVVLLMLFVVTKYIVWTGTRLLKDGEYLVYVRLRFIPFPARSRKRIRIRDIQVLDTDKSPIELMLHLNSSTMTIDTPSSEYEVFHHMRGVKDAERLKLALS